MAVAFPRLSRAKEASTRGHCDRTHGAIIESVKASLRDSGSLKEAFTDSRLTAGPNRWENGSPRRHPASTLRP
ncbi:hypothetical protein DL990_22510 [Amycolatopsis sp. WAC 01416]|nr:hypothetical protein DL990_22510 [Amycolatopsis sp. WAC 01416]